jgi:phage/plasmid-like protein (TIGR03299 family)
MTVGDMPWHKFGTKLNDVSMAQQAVRVARLDWDVLVEQGRAGRACRVLVRENSRETLAEVSADYVPIRNLDAFTFFDPIVKAGLAVYDSIGSLEEGRWLWITARMREDMVVAQDDPVAQFILLAYRHGSPGSPTLDCKPVRMAGKNTLHDGLLYPLIRVSATQGGRTELEDTPEAAMKKIALHFGSVSDRFRAMRGTKMNLHGVRSYLEAVFPKPRASGRGNRYRDPAARERAIEECTRLFVEGKGNDLPSASHTLWAAYSAISEYVDYYETRPNDPQWLRQVWGSPIKGYAMSKAASLMSEQ